MRFRGVISESGLRALEQYLGAVERFGRRAHLLLCPDDVYVVADARDADGMQVSARLAAVSRLRGGKQL